MTDLPAAKRRRVPLWAVLIIAAIAQFMVTMDTTIVNVALPDMRQGLDLSVVGQQWIVNAYALAFGGFLLLGGRVGDLYGRRRIFVAGLIVFTLASLAGGIAPNGATLIAARAVQGLGAAVLAPATLSVLITTYTEAKARTTALTVWSITASTGGVVGIVVGGVLTSTLDWRWVMFVNLPIGVGLLIAAAAYLTASPATKGAHRHLDLPGAATVTAGLALLIYAVVSTDTHSWGSAHTIVLLAVSVLLIAAFLLIESRTAKPLVPLRFFVSRKHNAANLTAIIVGATAASYFFFGSLYLQQVNDYTALRSGLAMAPASAATAFATMLSGRVMARVGSRVLLSVGAVFAAAGLIWMAQLDAGDSYAAHILPPTVLAMFGMGLCFVPMATLATQNVAREDAGLASGLLNASRQVGGALGLAVLVTVAASRTADYAGDHPGSVPDALTAGYDLGFVVAGVLFLAIVVIASVVLPRPRKLAGESPADRTDTVRADA